MKCANFQRRATTPTKKEATEELLREVMDVWAQTAIAVAGANDCKDPKVPAK